MLHIFLEVSFKLRIENFFVFRIANNFKIYHWKAAN